MSHFSVMIMTQDNGKSVDKLLEPYSANNSHSFNPKSKWDYWEEGGAWKNMLRLKNGTRANHARIKEINFHPSHEEYVQALRFWDIVVSGSMPETEREKMFLFYNTDYYRETYETAENYARIQTSLHTHAVITPDGVWHEPGRVGWFGCCDETVESARNWEVNFYKKFIAGKDEETIITIVDCHI